MKSAAEFHQLKCDGYRNINEIVRIEDRLHICETLYGDENAEILLLGQDGANFSTIKHWVEVEGEKGYRHGPKVKTNLNLEYCLDPYLKNQNADIRDISPETCGIYYANAIWLLKESNTMSGSIKNKKEVFEVCKPVFKETILGLRNLKCIITLGKISYQFVDENTSNSLSAWQTALTAPPQFINLYGRRLLVGAVRHPSPLSGGKNINDLKSRFQQILSFIQIL